MNTSKVAADNTADVELANKIMHTMIVKGISLKALSDTADISYSNLRRSLHQSRDDRRSFKFQELARIASALDTPASVLVAA